MKNIKMQTTHGVDKNIEQLSKLYPNCITEVISGYVDSKGKPCSSEHKDAKAVYSKAVDFDKLKQELSKVIVEGQEERYDFGWPDKKRSVLKAYEPITKTLVPCIEESVNFDTTKNLYIEGDNLDALKLLQETYLNKIKMIYIDPPYNTGGDFVYKDDYKITQDEWDEQSGEYDEDDNRLFQNKESNGRFHTDWLNMIYPRLKLAKDLLTDDGVIFISIADEEQANLKKICDEVFGEQNFLSQLVWQSAGGSNTGTSIVTITEYILAYAKDASQAAIKLGMKNGDYKLEDKYVQQRGKHELQKLDGKFTAAHFSKSLSYPIILPDGKSIYPGGQENETGGWNWRWSKTKVEWGIENGFIEFVERSGQYTVYFKNYEFVDNTNLPRKPSVPPKNMIGLDIASTSSGTQEINELFDSATVFEFSKASKLIKHLMGMIETTDAIILDFFSGSATTAHAVMQLNAEDGGNRKFILVQLPEATPEDSEARKAGYGTIPEIGKERIRRAGLKIVADNSKGSLTNRLEELNMFRAKYWANKKAHQEYISTHNPTNHDTSNSLYESCEEAQEVWIQAYSEFARIANETDKKNLDIGFRVLKIAESNMLDVHYRPEEFTQMLIDSVIDNIKNGAKPIDLLFQVLLELDTTLDLPLQTKEIHGKTVYIYGTHNMDKVKVDTTLESIVPAVLACFDKGLDDTIVKELCKYKPLYAVFRGSCFADDNARLNCEQLFKDISPQTEVKVL